MIKLIAQVLRAVRIKAVGWSSMVAKNPVQAKLEELAKASGGITEGEVLDRAIKLYERTLEEAKRGHVIEFHAENLPSHFKNLESVLHLFLMFMLYNFQVVMFFFR